LVSIFLPSFLLVVGVLPFWEKLRNHPAMRSTVQGINAVVVGLLLSAFYNPVWVSAVKTPVDFSLVVLSFLLLVFWRFPSWSVVLLNVLFGIFLELNRF
jgi:chromate transporter